MKLPLLSFNVTRSMYSFKLYSEKSTFPLSKMVQQLIMLDGSPTVTSISFKSFKLILSFVLLVSGPTIYACFSLSLTYATSLLISLTPTSPIDFILIMATVLAVNIIILRLNLPSTPNCSTFFHHRLF
jgi:hypothetical protein